MKKLIVACALVSLVACQTEKKAVSDPSGANMPKAGCCEGMKANCDASKAECQGKTPDCCKEKAKPQG